MNVLTHTPPAADHRIHYGDDESQFGDLWLPSQTGNSRQLPVVVFLHGGWWQSGYDLAYAGHLCAALKMDGIAVWSVEYRRCGATGGGWPATFQDAAAGFDYVATLAKSYPLDLSRVVAMGHSAGGHLAFWLAGRHHIEPHSPVHDPQPKVPLYGLIALAGAVDLRLTIDLAGYFTFAHDKQEVYRLMGGGAQDFDDRYRAGNPGDLLPLGVRQVLIQGTDDQQIQAQIPARWADQARRQGDDVTLHIVRSADHFDVVDPQSSAWPTVRESVRWMLL
jgi:acetyl esterase/lipase